MGRRKTGVSWGRSTPHGKWSRAYRPHFADENTEARWGGWWWLPSGHTWDFLLCARWTDNWLKLGDVGVHYTISFFSSKYFVGYLSFLIIHPAKPHPPLKPTAPETVVSYCPGFPGKELTSVPGRKCSRWASNIFYQKPRKPIQGHEGMSKALRGQFEKAPIDQSWDNLFKQ